MTAEHFNDAETQAALRLGITSVSIARDGRNYWQKRLAQLQTDASIVAHALERRALIVPASSPAPETSEAFNAALPVGTPVLYWPGTMRGLGRRSKTRTPAWDLGAHPVVSVEDYAGGIALSHVRVVDEPVPDGLRPAADPDEATPTPAYTYVCSSPDCEFTASTANPYVSDPCRVCGSRMYRRYAPAHLADGANLDYVKGGGTATYPSGAAFNLPEQISPPRVYQAYAHDCRACGRVSAHFDTSGICPACGQPTTARFKEGDRESWSITCSACGDIYTLAGALREVQLQAIDDGWVVPDREPGVLSVDYCPPCAERVGRR